MGRLGKSPLRLPAGMPHAESVVLDWRLFRVLRPERQ